MINLNSNNTYLIEFTNNLVKHINSNIKTLIDNKQLLGNNSEYKGEQKTDKYVYHDNEKKKQLIKCKLIDEANEIKILTYLKDNLRKIISSDIEKLKEYIVEIHDKFSTKITLKSNILKIIKFIFIEKGYESKISTTTDTSIAYKLVEELGVKTCPYCNRNYISFVKNKKKITRPQLDHFYPKSIYPFLACSFYNLIPSCSACNHMKGDDDSYIDEIASKLINPYNVSDKDFKFSYTLNDLKITEISAKKDIKFDYEDSIEIQLETKYDKNNEYFQLEEIYKNHKDIVIELILKEINYPKSYIQELIKNDFGTEEEIYRFLFSNYLDIDTLHKRPLSKLTRDISKELGILEKIKLAVISPV